MPTERTASIRADSGRRSVCDQLSEMIHLAGTRSDVQVAASINGRVSKILRQDNAELFSELVCRVLLWIDL